MALGSRSRPSSLPLVLRRRRALLRVHHIMLVACVRPGAPLPSPGLGTVTCKPLLPRLRGWEEMHLRLGLQWDSTWCRPVLIGGFVSRVRRKAAG